MRVILFANFSRKSGPRTLRGSTPRSTSSRDAFVRSAPCILLYYYVNGLLRDGISGDQYLCVCVCVFMHYVYIIIRKCASV